MSDFDLAVLKAVPFTSEKPLGLADIAANHYGVLHANKGQRSAVSKALYRLRKAGRILDTNDGHWRRWWRRG